MCNLYSHTKGPAAIIAMTRALFDSTGNLSPQPGIFPDYSAPIVRNTAAGRELAFSRWGMPSSRKSILDAATKRADRLRAKGQEVDLAALLKVEPDGGTTNVRNVASSHWKPWLGVEHRCVVPWTSFSEFNAAAGGHVWFAMDPSRPLAFFAGLWLAAHESVRKARTGVEKIDVYAFLTTNPNREVAEVHPKAMPVILTNRDEIETWLTAPWPEASKLQRPLPDGSLTVVARGGKSDGDES